MAAPAQVQEVDKACKEYKDRLEKSTTELANLKESKQQLKVEWAEILGPCSLQLNFYEASISEVP